MSANIASEFIKVDKHILITFGLENINLEIIFTFFMGQFFFKIYFIFRALVFYKK